MTPENSKFKKWEPYEIWGLINAQKLCEEHNAAISKLNELTAEVARLSVQVADADTLYSLAEIGYNAWLNDMNVQSPGFRYRWECLGNIPQKALAESTAAILRAAKPYVDASLDVLLEEVLTRTHGVPQSKNTTFEWLNSRIRYGVEVPALEPDDDSLTAVYMCGKHDGRKERLDAEAAEIRQEADELLVSLRREPTEADIEELAQVLRETWCGLYHADPTIFTPTEGDYAMARAAWAHLKGGA